MRMFGPAPLPLVVALVVVACGKSREAARSDAGAPTLTGATVPAGTAEDASVEPSDAAARDAGAAPATEVGRISLLGAVVEDAGDDRGATVTRLTPASQAASVLRPGDVVTAIDRVRVRNADELARYLEKAKRGIVVLTVEREGTARDVVLTRP